MGFMYQLDFKTVSLWRYPIERTLVKQAMKQTPHKITLENETWKIEGCPVDSESQKRLSNIALAWKLVLHWTKFIFSKYRKKFHFAVLTLENLQNQAKAALEAEKVKTLKNAESKKKALINSQEHLAKALQEAEGEKTKLEKFKKAFEEQEESKKKVIEKHQGLQKKLENYWIQKKDLEAKKTIVSFFSGDNTKALEKEVKELGEALNKETEFASIRFERMASAEIIPMIQHQKEEVIKIENEVSSLRERFNKKLIKKQEKVEKTEKELSDFTTALEKAEQEFLKISPAIRQSLNDPEAQKNKLYLDTISTKNASVNFQKNTCEIEFLNFLSQFNQHFALLFANLFNNFKQTLGPNIVTSFQDLGGGNGAVYFNDTLRMWLSSKDKNNVEDPKGGVVFRLGDNQNHLLKFKISGGKLEFIEGFKMSVKVNGWIRVLLRLTGKKVEEFIDPNVDFLHFKNENAVILSASKFGHSKPRTKTFNDLMENWGQNGKVLKRDETDEAAIRKHL